MTFTDTVCTNIAFLYCLMRQSRFGNSRRLDRYIALKKYTRVFCFGEFQVQNDVRKRILTSQLRDASNKYGTPFKTFDGALSQWQFFFKKTSK